MIFPIVGVLIDAAWI